MKKRKWLISTALFLVILGAILLSQVFIKETLSSPVFYVANAGDGTLSIIDFNGSDSVNSIDIQYEQLSHGIAISPDEKTVYFGSGFNGKRLLAFDVETEEIINELKFDEGIHGIDIHPSGKYLYVSLMAGLGEEGGVLTVIDTENFEQIGNITTDDGPAHVSVSNDGSQVWVSNVNGDTVSAIDAYTLQVLATIPVGDVPNEVALSPKMNYAFSANVNSNSLSIIDMNTFEVIDEVEVGEGVHGVTVSPDGNEVWTANNHSNNVSVVDAETFSLIATIETGSYANHISFTPDGNIAFVTNRQSNNIVVIDRKSKEIVNELNVGKEPHEMTLKGMLSTTEIEDISELWEQNKQKRYSSGVNEVSENVAVAIQFLSPYNEKDLKLITEGLENETDDPFRYLAYRIDMTTHSGDLTSIPFDERITLQNNNGDRVEPVKWVAISKDSHHPQYLVIFDKIKDGKPLLTDASTQLTVSFEPFITNELKLQLLP